MNGKTKAERQTQAEKDARGQFAPKQSGGESDGVMSAKPVVITGSEDATVDKRPPEKHAEEKVMQHDRKPLGSKKP
ncbi:hypothetical protein NAC44_16840 [Allorhizobium sp. BGMRC 0089]|uniref:hypothetical protein n=1 Tax=Allorhizobium sonneratiae TaxID=2934936 RepID=UPI002033A9E0|nr:hypothetical protein [Allorhizobium sonneratiae]MCM2293994.1 hypothetical protein [Allorhizobium sonneratiae]